MLLEFKTKNYKSFKNEMSFSLVPAQKQKGLDYSILRETLGSKEVKALCSAVIYGPNAAGKSNIIGAMDTFKAIILRGHIKNEKMNQSVNTAAYSLELIPNKDQVSEEPVFFSIKFIVDHVQIEYSLEIAIGQFLDENSKRKILNEILIVNEKLIFSRNDELIFDNLPSIKSFLSDSFELNKESAINISKSNLNDEELFLSNGFKNIFSSKLVNLIKSWIEMKFLVIYRADKVNVIREVDLSNSTSVEMDTLFKDAVSYFGSNSNKLDYLKNTDDSDAKLYSILKSNNEDLAIPAEIYESYGTVRFVNMFPLVLGALLNGAILIVDEFDASLHPMALMSIINAFHNNEINTNHAQLVFNTHNPIFLNSNLYRRDEIKFVERNEETHISEHYSLSDFKTIGKNGVRKNEDFMSNYFVNRYGAIKDIDFTPIFEKLVNTKIEVRVENEEGK